MTLALADVDLDGDWIYTSRIPVANRQKISRLIEPLETRERSMAIAAGTRGPIRVCH
jgi:hypothetical protein